MPRDDQVLVRHVTPPVRDEKRDYDLPRHSSGSDAARAVTHLGPGTDGTARAWRSGAHPALEAGGAGGGVMPARGQPRHAPTRRNGLPQPWMLLQLARDHLGDKRLKRRQIPPPDPFLPGTIGCLCIRVVGPAETHRIMVVHG